MIPKFRAWDKDNEHMYFVAEINLVEELISVDEYDYIFDFSDVVLMQSTGLFDKNGKEIFEGDVVRIFDEKLSKIYYSDGAFCVDILNGGTPLHAFLSDLHAFLSEQLEVIGNVWEGGNQ
ncbi:TPA: YopX family protein [Streptococcus suis]